MNMVFLLLQTGDITYIDYLFLGDYVDRGQHNLETIILLLALKVLKKLVDDASKFLNDKVTKVVVIVAAYLNDSHRTATKSLRSVMECLKCFPPQEMHIWMVMILSRGLLIGLLQTSREMKVLYREQRHKED